MWGKYRKVRPEDHRLASRGLPSDDRDPEGRIFLSHHHTNNGFLFLLTTIYLTKIYFKISFQKCQNTLICDSTLWRYLTSWLIKGKWLWKLFYTWNWSANIKLCGKSWHLLNLLIIYIYITIHLIQCVLKLWWRRKPKALSFKKF